MIKTGDFYIDCGDIPRLCIDNNGEGLAGISLLDGTVGNCSIRYCKPRKVKSSTAINQKLFGPRFKKDKERIKAFYASEWGNGRKIWWEE